MGGSDVIGSCLDNNNINKGDSALALFTTKVDPTSFKVLNSEAVPLTRTEGMGAQLQKLHALVASRAGAITGKSLLEFCHNEDKDVLR